MSDKIKMLRGKLALGTKGPLRVSMSGYSVKSYDADVPIVAAVHGGPTASPRQLEAWINNADLIVEAVNHLDALVDVAEAASMKAASCTFCGGTGVFRIGITDTAYDTDCPACSPIRAALAKLSAVE